MQFLAILALAFAASVSACKDDNIFCAPGMHARSVDTTANGGFSNAARAVAVQKVDAEIVAE
jgi:hypothetical protein